MILVDTVGKQELFQSVVGLSMAAGIFAALEAIRGFLNSHHTRLLYPHHTSWLSLRLPKTIYGPFPEHEFLKISFPSFVNSIKRCKMPRKSIFDPILQKKWPASMMSVKFHLKLNCFILQSFKIKVSFVKFLI